MYLSHEHGDKVMYDFQVTTLCSDVHTAQKVLR